MSEVYDKDVLDSEILSISAEQLQPPETRLDDFIDSVLLMEDRHRTGTDTEEWHRLVMHEAKASRAYRDALRVLGKGFSRDHMIDVSEEIRKNLANHTYELELDGELPSHPVLVSSDHKAFGTFVRGIACATQALSASQELYLTARMKHQETPVQGLFTLPPDDYAIISARINGAKFSREEEKDLFKQSYVRNKFRTTDSGLELTAMYKFLRDQEGGIKFGYENGDATLNFYIPCELQLPEGLHEPQYGQGKKILVVDDMDLYRQILSTSMENAGYDPDIAGSGKEAKAKVKNFRPDLILMDVRLANENGLAIGREIEFNYQVPVVYISGDTRQELDKDGFKVSSRFITKDEKPISEALYSVLTREQLL